MDIGRLNDLIAGFLLLRRGSEIYPVLIDIKEEKADNEIWLSNWKEVGEYVPYSRFQLIIIDIYDILKKISSDLIDKQYFCGICRLIRFEILSKIIMNPKYHFHKKIRASIDGTSLNRSSFCPDSIDLYTLGINSLISNFPIFTPVIGFGEGRINDLISKISKISFTFRSKPSNDSKIITITFNRMSEIMK